MNVPRISYVESLAGVLVGWYSDHSGLMLRSVRGRPGLPMLRGGLPGDAADCLTPGGPACTAARG